MHDTTNTCSCDCGVRATVPSETTVSRESKHDSKQLYNSERILSDRGTRGFFDFQGCSEHCCTTRSRRQNNNHDSVSAPSTRHKQQGRRTEVLRQATNRGGTQLCVKTLQMTVTMIHEGETMKQMSWSTCPVTVVLSKAGNPCPKAHTTNAGALPGQKVPPLQKNPVSFQMESKSGPCGLDVHGHADDADFTKQKSNPVGAHAETDLTLRLSGSSHSRSSHMVSLRH